MGVGGWIRTREGWACIPTGFPDQHLRPLSHLDSSAMVDGCLQARKASPNFPTRNHAIRHPI